MYFPTIVFPVLLALAAAGDDGKSSAKESPQVIVVTVTAYVAS